MLNNVSSVGSLRSFWASELLKEPKSHFQEPETLHEGKGLGSRQSWTLMRDTSFLVPLPGGCQPSFSHSFCLYFCSLFLYFIDSSPELSPSFSMKNPLAVVCRFPRVSAVLGNLRQRSGRDELRPGKGSN